MERIELLEKMRSARTPNEIATAIVAAREWLAAHPDDADVALAGVRLLRVEQNVLVIAS